jgi:hypothetical protein
VFQVNKKKCTRREFKMTTEIRSYEMDSVMLDLGSYVNIFPKKSLELMGKPNLVWSPIQLWLENQYIIYPIGQLEWVEVNIEGVKTKEYFEAIEITDDSDTYHALLSIDWEFNNNVVLNLKNRQMSFETDTTIYIYKAIFPSGASPLDPAEGVTSLCTPPHEGVYILLECKVFMGYNMAKNKDL